MKKIIIAILTIISIIIISKLAIEQDAKLKAEQDAKINASTVVAYQASKDGALQLTFKDGSGYYFEDMHEVLDYMNNILNYDFIINLKDSYNGHSDLIKLQLLQLSIKMQKIEMFGSC